MSSRRTRHASLSAWVDMVSRHTTPARVHWWTGARAERAQIESAMVRSGELVPLDSVSCARSFLYPKGHEDGSTQTVRFTSTDRQVDAGPTNNWLSRNDARTLIWPLFREAMRGRTLYVVPYLLGAPDSPFCRVGVELTDSPYIALCLDTMTRAGDVALEQLGSSLNFVNGLHSTGECRSNRRFVVHFPDTVETWSIGSERLEDSLLSSGPQGRLLASAQAREEGWLAENMAICAVTDPAGATVYVAVASANGCADSDLVAARGLHGWKVDVCSRRACWMRPGADGRLWAICPDFGRWERVADLSQRIDEGGEPAALHAALFSDVALFGDRRDPEARLDPLERATCLAPLRGQSKRAGVRTRSGVPISAIVFCGREAKSAAPIVYQARSWRQGVYIGATLVDAVDGLEQGRHDPMGMLGSCGYNLADYFAHWLAIGRKLHDAPKIFHVNWTRTDAGGRQIWPGRDDNVGIFRWIAQRSQGNATARATPFGWVPELLSLDLAGLAVPPERLALLTSGSHGALLRQAERARAFLQRFGESLPSSLLSEHQRLVRGLQESLH